MKAPTQFFLSSILLGLLSLPVQGNTYRGTITQTVTDTNHSTYAIGQSFVGYYEYESSSVDGVFYTAFAPYARPADANETLTGLIRFLYPEGYPGPFNELTATVNEGKLTVSGGTVTDFFWSWELGGNWTYLTLDTCYSVARYDRPYDPNTGEPVTPPFTLGSVSFGAPVLRVPDATSTGALMLLAGLVLLPLHRGTRRPV